MLYDADFGFCTRSAHFMQRAPRPDANVAAWQDVDLAMLVLTPGECDAALQWVDWDGRAHSAQRAVARLLLTSRLPWRPMGFVLRRPGVDQLAGAVYRLVAANRQRLHGGSPACTVPTAPTDTSGLWA